MICNYQTKIRGIIGILKNANILITRDSPRNLTNEVSQIILLEVLRAETYLTSLETVRETLSSKVYKQQKLCYFSAGCHDAKNLVRDINFDIVTKVITSLAASVVKETLFEEEFIASNLHELVYALETKEFEIEK